MSISSFIKGWVGEAAGAAAQYLLLDKEIYTSLNNVTIPTSNGTTQIDHIIVSKYGIFVIETKNMSGWIFGDAKSPQWTQSLFGKKYRFQNPLHQNYRHTKALEEFLGVEQSKLKSIVMFWGECELKTELPKNVMTRGFIGHIKKHTDVLFADEEVSEIVASIKSGMMPKGLIKSFQTRGAHLQSLDERHSSTTTCPKCGKALILRAAKSGKNAGQKFYGCSGFPSCRFTRQSTS
jgi:restriction system protein